MPETMVDALALYHDLDALTRALRARFWRRILPFAYRHPQKVDGCTLKDCIEQEEKRGCRIEWTFFGRPEPNSDVSIEVTVTWYGQDITEDCFNLDIPAELFYASDAEHAAYMNRLVGQETKERIERERAAKEAAEKAAQTKRKKKEDKERREYERLRRKFSGEEPEVIAIRERS